MIDVQDTQVPEPLEGAFRDVADGVVAEAQDAQAAQVSQTLLLQPCEVVEGQNPERGTEAQVSLPGCLSTCPLLSLTLHGKELICELPRQWCSFSWKSTGTTSY